VSASSQTHDAAAGLTKMFENPEYLLYHMVAPDEKFAWDASQHKQHYNMSARIYLHREQQLLNIAHQTAVVVLEQ
jgi:hypothetical protein